MKTVNYAIIRSLCALVIGILLVVWPDVAVSYLVITIGALFIVPGLYGMFAFFASRKKDVEVRRAFPVAALGSTLLGLWLMVMPGFFVEILMYVLGAMLVLGGMTQLINFASARAFAHVPIGVYIIPSLILIAGLVVLFNPFEVAAIPFMVLGVSAIVYSATDLARLIVYRREEKKMKDESDKMMGEMLANNNNDDIEDIEPIEEIKD